MSRVGLKPINIPSGVTVTIDGAVANVKGPKGAISKELPGVCSVKQENNIITVSRPSDDKYHRSMHGLTRALIANMVDGVSEVFSKQLEIVGVGYKAEMKGKDLVLTVGFSHPVVFSPSEGIEIKTPSPTQINISGIEKDKVGQTAANIRGVRPPEPYKGKGIKYTGEFIQRKAGKTAAGT